ncbi:MAB_1171c family putative transporter [Crossiella cryophila]|uniref:Putative membrane protein n=1 Tax=Crossiella cryophila TaxID=43355 RepID=A0A7W7CGU5_9PSEU|nr:MAB_1171c family putative transporter [Crossiella cryophila]MBB4679518.1 putative membrane protein [Crossiella cryophila]
MGLDLMNFLFAAGAFAILAHKLRSWQTVPVEQRPVMLPLCVSAAGVGTTFLIAAPVVGMNINLLSGFPLSIMLMSLSLLTWVCAGQLMVIYWRHPAERAWRSARWRIGIYSTIAVIETVLFALGQPTGEHHNDFITVYANDPFLGGMTVLHFATYAVGMLTISVMCWKWSTESTTAGRPWLRRGLRLITVGFAMSMISGVSTVVAVTSSWLGTDLLPVTGAISHLMTVVSLPVVVVGTFLPLAGPKVSAVWAWLVQRRADLRDTRTLAPLWRELLVVDPKMVHRQRPLIDWFNADSRLYWRVIEINDWLERLRPYRSQEVAADISGRLHALDLDGDVAWPYQEAGEIRAALQARQHGLPGPLAEAADEDGAAVRTSHAFAAERARLVLVATVFSSSTVDSLVIPRTQELAGDGRTGSLPRP